MEDFFSGVKTVAIIGLSNNQERHSYKVASYFQARGFKIIPVNPNVDEVLGEKAYSSLSAIPKEIKIDVVDIFRRPEEVIQHLKEVVQKGNIEKVWLQEGVGSAEAEDFAKQHNLLIISNFCIMAVYKNEHKDL